MKSTIFRGIVYTALGSLAEVIFTALKDWPRLQGHTQIWVLPLYFSASIYIFEPLFYLLGGLPLVIRGVVYSAIILFIEYLAALLIDSIFGIVPWKYERSYLINSSYIRLEYAPIWAAMAIVGEVVFYYLSECKT